MNEALEDDHADTTEPLDEPRTRYAVGWRTFVTVLALSVVGVTAAYSFAAFFGLGWGPIADLASVLAIFFLTSTFIPHPADLKFHSLMRRQGAVLAVYLPVTFIALFISTTLGQLALI